MGEKNGTYDLFLSYDHSLDSEGRNNCHRVSKLEKELKKVGALTLHDNTQSGGDIMTSGVDSCDLVVVFVSENYVDKVAAQFGVENNILQEFEYCARRKGINSIIPVVLENSCSKVNSWHGPLGATLKNLEYLDFTRDVNMYDVLKGITKRIKRLNQEIFYNDGKYIGALNRNRLPHGLGKIIYSNGITYDGSWIQGRKEGVNGIWTNVNGEKYHGEFLDDDIEGSGEYFFSDGSRIVADFVKRKAEGDGKCFDKDGGLIYEGTFKSGEYNGFGYLIEENGCSYEGNFRAGIKFGRGVYTIPDFGVYEGTFEQGQLNGEGTLKLESGDSYRGYFKDSKYHGSGEYSFANGSKYIGEYNLGMKHGQGKYIFTDGKSYYSGKWENNLMSGYGEQVFSNGDMYTGNYENNKCHGQGKIYVNASKTTYVGEWMKGEMVKTKEVQSHKDEESNFKSKIKIFTEFPPDDETIQSSKASSRRSIFKRRERKKSNRLREAHSRGSQPEQYRPIISEPKRNTTSNSATDEDDTVSSRLTIPTLKSGFTGLTMISE